jgi:F-type H+-transporting ATPase subunit a
VGPLSFDEGTVVTWIIMAVILVICLVLSHGLKVDHISRRQAAAEFLVTKLEALTGDMLGEEAKEYSGYIIAVLIYLSIANVISVFGLKPPTKGLNVTLALALMSIVLVQAAGIRAKGVKGWLKAFTQPVGIITPFNILDLFTRPLSLCMRLFGNVLAAFVIMKVLETVVPLFLPAVFCLYFDFFDGILQAYVFVFLTSLYISEAVE